MTTYEILSFVFSILSIIVSAVALVFSAITFYYKLPRGKAVMINAAVNDHNIHLSVDFENDSYYGVTIKTIQLIIDNTEFAPTTSNRISPVLPREETKNLYFPSFTCTTFSALFQIENASQYAEKPCVLILNTTRKKLTYHLTLPSSQLNGWTNIL